MAAQVPAEAAAQLTAQAAGGAPEQQQAPAGAHLVTLPGSGAQVPVANDDGVGEPEPVGNRPHAGNEEDIDPQQVQEALRESTDQFRSAVEPLDMARRNFAAPSATNLQLRLKPLAKGAGDKEVRGAINGIGFMMHQSAAYSLELGKSLQQLHAHHQYASQQGAEREQRYIKQVETTLASALEKVNAAIADMRKDLAGKRGRRRTSYSRTPSQGVSLSSPSSPEYSPSDGDAPMPDAQSGGEGQAAAAAAVDTTRQTLDAAAQRLAQQAPQNGAGNGEQPARRPGVEGPRMRGNAPPGFAYCDYVDPATGKATARLFNTTKGEWVPMPSEALPAGNGAATTGHQVSTARVPQPQKYSGEGQEAVEDVIFAFENYLTGSKVPKSSWPVHAMPLLTGKALQAYIAYAQPVQAAGNAVTWEEFVGVLQTFARPDRQLAARSQLFKSKQGGSVQEYLQNFKILVSKCGNPPPTDKDLMLAYWEGLKPNVKADSQVDPKTGRFWVSFEDLSKHTLAVELSRKIASNATDAAASGSRQDHAKDRRHWKASKSVRLAAVQAGGSAGNREDRKDHKPGRQSGKQGFQKRDKKGEGFPPPPNKGGQDRANVICRACGGRGHYQNECATPKKPRTN